MSAAFVTSILGETKPVEFTWPDGSHQCPFCGYAANGDCDNPACPASRHATPANRNRFAEAARQAAERAADDAARKRNHAIAMARLTADREAAKAARIAWARQVTESGGCHACSDQYRGKVRRHRGECPKRKR